MFGVNIPLPIAAALLAGIVAARVMLANRSFGWSNGLIGLFFALLGIQSILTSIRFGSAVKLMLPAQPILAMLIGPIAYIAFRTLCGPRDSRPEMLDLLHLTPAVLMAGIVGSGIKLPLPIDSLIWLSFLVYCLLLFREIKDGPDTFERFGTEATKALTIARIATLFLLVIMLVYDVIIFINLEYLGGVYTGIIVAAGSLLLIVISITILTFSNFFLTPSASGQIPALSIGDPMTASVEDSRVYGQIDDLMSSKRLFLDPNINITRVARQLNVPARSVSNAVNRVSNRNFSQFVNHYRVNEACLLLKNSEMPVTELMFEAGFQTKSTFNREFLATTGMSPSDFRREAKSTT